MLNFNIDNFDEEQLKIKRIELIKNHNLMVVEEFKNAEKAKEYLQKITIDQEVFRDVNPQGVEPIIISKSNYKTLSKAGNSSQYMLFFKENY
jgi:pimeloyl-CoA synthetase